MIGNNNFWKSATLLCLMIASAASTTSSPCNQSSEIEYKVVVSPAIDSAAVALEVKRVNDDGTERMRLRKNDYFANVPDQAIRECVSKNFCFKTKMTRGEGTYKVFWDGEHINIWMRLNELC